MELSHQQIVETKDRVDTQYSNILSKRLLVGDRIGSFSGIDQIMTVRPCIYI